MTAYDLRISDWSSDVCSSDLSPDELGFLAEPEDLRDLYRRLRFGAYDPGARPRASSEPRGLRPHPPARRPAGALDRRPVDRRDHLGMAAGTAVRRRQPSSDRKSTRLNSSH